MNTVPANFANPACEVCGKYFANSAYAGGICEVLGSRENWVKICAQMQFWLRLPDFALTILLKIRLHHFFPLHCPSLLTYDIGCAEVCTKHNYVVVVVVVVVVVMAVAAVFFVALRSSLFHGLTKRRTDRWSVNISYKDA